MQSGSTVVISGLIHKAVNRANKGIPILSDIPIISDIFSLNSESKLDSELAVIVSPTIRFRAEELVLYEKLEELLVEVLGEESAQ